MTIEEIKELIQIDKNCLDLVCESHASIYDEIGENLTKAVNKRDALKDEFDDLYARIDLSIRNEHGGEKGWTENRIENTIITRSDYVSKKEELRAANEEVNIWSQKKESFSQRGYMIRELCEIYKAGYFNTIPEGQTQEVTYDVGRERLRRAREQ
jgi:hypothetical protein